MGGSTSKTTNQYDHENAQYGAQHYSYYNQTPFQTYYYRTTQINDESINYVLRQHSSQLSYDEISTLRQAQYMAAQELGRTMKHCELRITLYNSEIIIRAGDCSNVINAWRSSSGDIEWKFVQRGRLQKLYDAGRGFFSLVKNFFRYTLPIASRVAGPAIGWY